MCSGEDADDARVSNSGARLEAHELKCWQVDGSKSRPQEVTSGAEAEEPDQGHPDTGYEVDAALGEGADAAPLAPASACEGVEAEGEGDEPGGG